MRRFGSQIRLTEMLRAALAGILVSMICSAHLIIQSLSAGDETFVPVTQILRCLLDSPSHTMFVKNEHYFPLTIFFFLPLFLLQKILY